MRKQDNEQEFSRRAVIFGTIKTVVFTALFGRLFYLQFIKSEEYKTLAEGNSIKLVLVPPFRGSLLDRLGVPLAQNQKNYRMMIEIDDEESAKRAMQAAAKILPISEDTTKEVVAAAHKGRFVPPMLVKDHLSWEEVSKIEFNTPHLPGAFIDVGQIRYYPQGDKAAHLIGYIGTASEGEVKQAEEAGLDVPLFKHPDFKLGKSGAEKMLEDTIRGSAGLKQVEVNVRGVSVQELSSKDSTPGKDVKLTVDARLQEYAAAAFGEESGGAAVIDVKNGDVLALVSMPAYDPNIFSMGIPHEYWKALHDDKKKPLINKVISGQYPPGSTFKMLVGLAGLEANAITPASGVYCPGHFFLGSHQFNCWKEGGHGTVNLEHAIAESCDTYFYTVAQKIGIERIADMARRFGLGKEVGLGLQAEQPGIVPDKEWKRRRYKEQWQGGDTINVGIGQGYVLATPLQLAVMAARLASGMEVVPRLVLPDEKEEPPAFDELKVNVKLLEQVQKGMDSVTNAPFGTAYSKRILQEEFAMAGKTGTSQVRKITVRGRDQKSIPWEERHHALFVGYAPVSAPRYAVAVLVEHGGGGASAAAPIARDILQKLQELRAQDEKEADKPQAKEKPL